MPISNLGTKKHPVVVRVKTMEKAQDIMKICSDNGWHIIAGVEPDNPEDISDFEYLMKNPPKKRLRVKRVN
jgi:hypothetical protein